MKADNERLFSIKKSDSGNYGILHDMAKEAQSYLTIFPKKTQQTQEEEGETRELTIKKICSKIPGILSTLIVAYILRETVELELLKVVVEDGQNNIYLIKSIHQLLKKIITYYGTFITAPEIIVSFIQGIDFKNNTLSFPGNYAQLYECMGTYDEIGDEITNDTMYKNM